MPADASPLAHRVAETIASFATVHLLVGHALHLALEHLALGRAQVTRHLDAVGITRDRNTVAAAIEELCRRKVLTRVGQLPSWHDRVGPAQSFLKQGAFTYALNITARQLGQVAHRALTRTRTHATATLRGERLSQRVLACLEAAVELAMVGIRNDLGHWLTCRCTDERLTEGETMKVLESYRAGVPEKHSYTLGEMTATVRGRYRKRGSLIDPDRVRRERQRRRVERRRARTVS